MPRSDSARALGAYNASKGRAHFGLSAEDGLKPQNPEPSMHNSSWVEHASLKRKNKGLQTNGEKPQAFRTAGIAIFAIIAALVLILGCWYCKRRNGYKILGTRHFSPTAIRSMMGASREAGECKVPLQDYNTLNNVVPGAPPAYEKIAGETQPPPYTP